MLQCPQCGREFPPGVSECPDDGAVLRADVTSVSELPADPLAGRVLDEKYRLEERLGEGGMGTVYRATHLLIERHVAVKVLNARLVTDEAARERFRREARAAGRLQHSNAVAVTDFGETKDGLAYIVMELLEGRQLRDVITREAPLDPARAVSLMLQISAAVSAAHDAGIIHRDLKPGNIFVVQRPHAPHIVKVLDFGIAKVAEDAEGNPVNTLTGTGVMIGTPRYMSPEQCDGGELTFASDVYSLGVILYEMLTGQTPFSGATPLALALKHSTEQPRRPGEIVPNLPPSLEAVVLHALEKDPNERPADAGAFRRELFETAELLGLEHSAGFSAPTIETLRDAGTETPSGRLVIDLERLRQNRAAQTRESKTASDTAGEAVAGTAGLPPRLRAAESSGARHEGHAPPSRRRGYVRRRLRVRVPTAEGPARENSFPSPLAIAAVAAVGLLLGLLGYVIYRSTRDHAAPTASSNSQTPAPSSSPSVVADDAVGRTLLGSEVAPRPRPSTAEPRAAAEFYERGAYLFSSRDFDGAARDFRRALELQPEFPEAHNRLGRALMVQGRLQDAAEEFRAAAAQRGGNYPAALYNLGFTLQSAGQFDQAIGAYADAIRASGGQYPDAYFQTGVCHLNRNRYPEAADALRRAIEQNQGRDPEAQDNLGVALVQLNDLQGAEAAFRAAIDGRGGDYPAAHLHLGTLYSVTGRTADAIKELEIYVLQEPNPDRRRDGEKRLSLLRQRLRQEERNAR